MAKQADRSKRAKTKAAKKKAVKKKAVAKEAAKSKAVIKKAAIQKGVTKKAIAVHLGAAGDPKQMTKQAALEAIDKKLLAAGDMKAKCKTLDCDQKMDQCMADLGAESTAIFDQAYIAAISDPGFTKAIAAIRQATEEMNAVVPNMKSATSFVSSLAGFFTAAGKVVPALKGLF